jgi:ABC-2 type transport system ATP-binding protein
LMRKLGRKQLTLELDRALERIPDALAPYGLEISADHTQLVYTYDIRGQGTGIVTLLDALAAAGIGFKDLRTTESSLEEIFVSLVREEK